VRQRAEFHFYFNVLSRLDWLRLIRTPNVGPRTFRTLVNHFGGARADAEREIAAAEKLGVALVALGEPSYPPRLQMIDDAPPLVAIRGQAPAFALPMVAVVGSRNASGAGMKFTQRIARELGEAGFAVVSGLARGIDAAAHRASLATGTIAVLAGGRQEAEPQPAEGGFFEGTDPAPDERTRILALLGPTAVLIDDLVRLSKSSPSVVRMVLLEIEIAGRLERHGGGLVSLA